MTQHLTYSQKKKWTSLILQRDGSNCFYCMLPIEHEEDREFDHLDNVESHNYPENLVFCHHACNVKKRITKQFIQEHTIDNEELILRDAVNAIVDICQDNNGTGSQSAVYRYVDFLTNPFTGKFTLSTNSQGKTIIRRRIEN